MCIRDSNDSLYNIALNGDDLNMGMLDVIEEFSGTNAANLAHYYTGMMYLNMNDYQNSIKFLSKFNSNDILLSSLATGSIGDAIINSVNKTGKAIILHEDSLFGGLGSISNPCIGYSILYVEHIKNLKSNGKLLNVK